MRLCLAVFFVCSTMVLAGPNDLPELQAQLAESGGVFFASGASNSAGFGLHFGLRDRILYHLATQAPDVIAALKEKKACLGLSVDRFFPTSFPILAEKNVTDARLRQAVTDAVHAFLQTRCTIVMSTLLDPSEVRPEHALPYQRMAQTLRAADPLGTRIRLVNKTLAELSRREPGLKVYRLPLTVVQAEQYFQHRGDDIHVNYAGQALLFNVFARDALRDLSGRDVPEMEYGVRADAAWQDEVVRTVARLHPQQRGEAKIINRPELAQDTHRKDGRSHKGVLTKKGDLVLIDKSVRLAVSTQNATLSLLLRQDEQGAKEYVLDLSALSYTKIVLRQTARDPKVFIGYGSDYWGYAIGFGRVGSPAFTNYIFVLTEEDASHAAIEWKIVPQLQVGAETQVIPKERMDHLVDPKGIWRPEIEKNLEEYDRLEYRLETELHWL